jgi:TonB family protein
MAKAFEVGRDNHLTDKDAGLAGILSLFLPGLGQIYGGHRRKGMLFVAVSLVSLLLLTTVLLSQSLLSTLISFGRLFHLLPNAELCICMKQLSPTSPPVLMFIAFFVAFAIYCIKDAYNCLLWQHKPIYPGHVLTMPEASSSSYLIHCVLLANFFVLALFFLIPHQPDRQVIVMELVADQPRSVKKPPTHNVSDHSSTSAGHHKKETPTTPSSGHESKGSTKTAVTPPLVAMAAPHKTNDLKPPSSSIPRNLSQAVKSPAPALPRINSYTLPAPTTISRAGRTVQPSPLVPTNTHTSVAYQQAPNPLLALTNSPSSVFTPAPVPSLNRSANSSANAAPLPPKSGNSGSQLAPAPGPAFINTKDINSHSQPVPGTTGQPGRQLGTAPQPEPSKGNNEHPSSPLIKPVLGSGNPASGNPASLISSIPRPGHDIAGNPEANQHPHDRPSRAAQPVDFGPYMAELQRAIRRAWSPPHKPDSRQTVVTFKIHANGQMTDLRLYKSCGALDGDQAALKAVEHAAPFHPLPDGWLEDADIQFTFDYKVFQGGDGAWRRF